MKVHILPTGTMHGDLTWLLLDPARVMGDRRNTSRPASWVPVPTHCVFVEHPDGTIMWDTGVPRDWEERWAPTGLQDYFPVDEVTEDMWLDSRLRRLGREPGEIDYLVLSHLHFDHAGHVGLWKGTDTRIVCGKAEYDGAFGFEGYSLGGHIRSDYDGLPFETVEDDTELLPGVTLLQTPGHTWGTMSLRVDLPDSGTMIFTSDAVYLEESYGPPPIGGAVVHDKRMWLASVEKIRSIAERTDATVVFGHSTKQLQSLRTTPGYYT